MPDTRLLAAGPLDVLKQDHDRLRILFRKHAQTPDDDAAARTELFQEIRRELRVHAAIEQEHVHPLLRGAALQDDDVAIEGLVEKLRAMNAGDRSYGALMKLLEENFSLHAAAEERDLLPRLRRLSPLEAYELTLRLENSREMLWRAEQND